MMFCPKCGSLLVPVDKKGKKVMGCSCGYVQKKAEEVALKEVIKKESEVELIHEEVEPYPLVDAQCPKCGHDKAYFWTVQTRASDEPETKFFKCEKCKHVWRDYN